MLSKTKIDQLGDQLRRGAASQVDLRLLDEYRRSFEPAIDTVTRQIIQLTTDQPTARPAKSTLSITEKLKREKVRLSQMQDVAGCRVVVRGALAQELFQKASPRSFPFCEIMDRRLKPSHGYRAVHILANVDGKTVEIQVRTQLQHLWAQMSEAYADRFGSEIKYGGGSPEIRRLLLDCSDRIQKLEEKELNPGDIEYSQENQHVTEFDAQWDALRSALQNMLHDVAGSS